MRSDEGARPSVWDETAEVPARPPLTESLDLDVCVIGAGIAGLTTAYHLARRGLRVAVLDDGPVGGGETGRTTAHLATAFDDYYHEVERLFGQERARLLAESFVAGVDEIERIVRDEGIDCDFRRLDGWWFPAEGSGDGDALDLLRREERAARRLGLDGVALVDDWPLGDRLGRPALRFPRQGQFHVHRYMAGLAAAVERHGGRIFSDAHVTEIADAPAEGGRCRVRTARGVEVRAADVVVAANTAINDRFAMHTKQAPYRTYVVAMRLTADVPLALYWDTDDPYHYVRRLAASGDGAGGAAGSAAGEGDLLLVGGEDHKTGQSDDEPASFDRLEAWARTRFPVGETVARWSGQVLEPVDHVAFIGRDPTARRVWLVTGDSGNGMTHGTIAGLLLPALIAGEGHRWEALYDPSRITAGAATEWLRENLNVGAQYADYVAPGEVASADEIPPGEGRIVRKGVEKLAVFRDPSGALSVRSAVCPHLFCIVDWNAAERTWDCPCHGSRFGTDGHVINGPSKAPLKEASLD